MDFFKDANWIFVDGVDTDVFDSTFYYKALFNTQKPKEVKLLIASHRNYAVYINGKFIDAYQYDDYEDFQIYDTIDITDFLKDGENELLIWHYVAGTGFSTCRKLIPGVIFTVISDGETILNSSTDTLSAMDKRVLGFKEFISEQLGYNLDFDANNCITEFKKSVLVGKEKHLNPRPVKKCIINEKPSGVLIKKGFFTDKNREETKSVRMQKAELFELNSSRDQKDGIWLLYDCGETSGFVDFSVEVDEPCEILIGFGEHLEDGRLRTNLQERNFTLRYITKKGLNNFFYPLLRIGLRYLCFYIYSTTVKVNYMGLREQNYDIKAIPFKTNSQLHQKIYDIGTNTLTRCMHERYEDCPWREQSLYAMDSRVQALCGYFAFKEYQFPRETFRLMAHSLRQDGLIVMCPPSDIELNIPTFTAVFVREVYENMLYSNSLELVKDIFPTLEKIVEGFSNRIAENGLIPLFKGENYWNFFEWRDGLNYQPGIKEDVFESLLPAFVADAFLCFAEICKKLKRNELYEKYLALRNELIKSINRHFWNEEEGAYSNLLDNKPSNELTQAMMLYIDAVPEEKKERVISHILNKDYVPVSLSTSIYLYDALLSSGEKYKDFVIGEIERIWGNMINAGATTFWETDLGASDFDNAGSLCHGWSSVPVYILRNYYYK